MHLRLGDDGGNWGPMYLRRSCMAARRRYLPARIPVSARRWRLPQMHGRPSKELPEIGPDVCAQTHVSELPSIREPVLAQRTKGVAASRPGFRSTRSRVRQWRWASRGSTIEQALEGRSRGDPGVGEREREVEREGDGSDEADPAPVGGAALVERRSKVAIPVGRLLAGNAPIVKRRRSGSQQ
jgi:hypothetical protein